MRVLISGAGIAGPSLAWWLQRYGFACTVVERSPTLRTEGQNVDIRGAAREVVRRMGLDDEVAARSTGEQGTRFIDGAGHSAYFSHPQVFNPTVLDFLARRYH